MKMHEVTTKPIDPNRIYDRLQKNTVGSVVLHYAVVRERTGNQVIQSIEFERIGDIEAELESIITRVREKCNVEDVLIVRRLGLLKIGQVMSLVATSAPHRKDAFDAVRYGVESLKKMKTIKKKEYE